MNTKKVRIEKHAEKLDAINKDLEGEILKRDKDLTLMAMSSIQQAELVDTVSVKLKTKSSEGFVNDLELEKILIELKNSKTKKVWEEFELRFKNLDSKFYDQLRQEFPSLTMNERRLSAFLKLQMTTKEIASLTGQSIRAVELARTRLRKKLNLTNSELSLYDFLLNYGK
jgi:DNA-binding CsgD family transcriptional regulator